MGARSGSNYLSALKRQKAEVWLGGERVAEVTSHPALRECARSIASLYDMQMERVEQMTYRTDDGGRSGLSFIQPKSIEELRKRSRMMAAWANFSGGMMLQTPDTVNVAIAAMASAREFFAASDPRYGDNIATYYLEARKHDWCATHTLIGPDAHFEKTADGVIVSGPGAMTALAPFAEELVVFPSVRERGAIALAFAIPCQTKGLKFLCRDRFDSDRSAFDAPLSSRFDVMDCSVVFENVLVPWSRVFLSGDAPRCEALLDETGARANMMHQAAVHNLAKVELFLGIAVRIGESNIGYLPGLRQSTLGFASKVAQPSGATELGQSFLDRLTEAIIGMGTIRRSLREAEDLAALDQFGVLKPGRIPLESARNLFAKLYPRIVELVQLLSGPNLIATAREEDIAYAHTRERTKLFRLACDATTSAFAGRHLLHERSLLADSITLPNDPALATDVTPLARRIDEFLDRVG